MKTHLRLIIVLLTFCLTTISFGQVETKNYPERNGKQVGLGLKNDYKSKKNKVLPKFDVQQMLAEDRKNAGRDIPFRFGKPFDLDIKLKDGDWSVNDGFREWSMEFYSEGALSINFVLEGMKLAEGAELYAFNEEGTVVYGPVTSLNNKDKGVFLTDIIPGERVTLFLKEPDNDSKSDFTIKRVVHGYRGIGEMLNGTPGASESCNNNIGCFGAWDASSDAVALVLLSSGFEHCSGSLLMSTNNGFRPYFLSAFHCIDTNNNGAITAAERTAAEDWMFKFQFKSVSCTSGTASAGYTYNDATFRAAWFPTDFSLMELDESPVGNQEITWAGWDRRVNTPTSGAGIHHPSGDMMKISIENNAFQVSSWNGANNRWLVNFDDGVVEHGSSGSPIFDQNRRVVGQLHGNQNYNPSQSYCSQPRAEYGRFNLSWTGGGTNATRLSNWLDPCGTGANTTNTTRSAFINGPTTTCASGSSYSITNLPAGASITWSSSSNITRNSSQGSNPCTFSLSGLGTTGWIQARITNGCGVDFTIRKNLVLNTGSVNLTIGTVEWEGSAIYVSGSVTGGSAPFKWYINNQLISTTSSRSFSHRYPCEGGSSSLGVIASCGGSDQEYYYEECSGSHRMAIYPNPADSEINISLSEENMGVGQSVLNENNDQEIQDVTLTLLDFSGNPVKESVFKGPLRHMQMDVSNLAKGIYFLKIIGREIDETHRIIVE